jgi:hypothetical protein
MPIAHWTELVSGVGVLLSVTVTTKARGFVVVAAVGVPLSVPSGPSVRPGGNGPVAVHRSGKFPPAAVNVKL